VKQANVFLQKIPRNAGFFISIFVPLPPKRNGRETIKKRQTVSCKKQLSESINKQPPTKSKNKSHFAQSGAKSFLNTV
jgi:hypothetical protein